jgi:AraC family transcriptional regulator
MEFPASKWVVFEVKGPVSTSMESAWRQIYSEWFPSNEYIPAIISPLEVFLILIFISQTLQMKFGWP